MYPFLPDELSHSIRLDLKLCRRRDYDLVERAKALAEYYQIVRELLGAPKPGRPKALTGEEDEGAR